MKISKIFNGIIGISAVSGIAYGAYKCGEYDGKAAERKRMETADDDEINVYDDSPEYDEPDTGCIAPVNKSVTSAADDTDEIKRRFAPVSSIRVDGVSDSMIRQILLRICMIKKASNKMIRDYVGLDHERAAAVLDAFADAGYVGKEAGNHKIPVYVTIHDFYDITH